MNHLMDNSLVGLALFAVLLIFLFSVGLAIAACFRPTLAPGNQNFTYVATAVAALVLTVASGVLGKPATVQLGTQTGGAQTASAATNTVQVSFADSQTGSFQKLYAWCYIIAGLGCLVVFIMKTPATEDLVKNVALTTLGFLVTIVGGLTAQVPPTISSQANAVRSASPMTVIQKVEPRNSVLF